MMDFVNTSFTSLCHHFQTFDFSSFYPCIPSLNATPSPSVILPNFGLSYFTMTFGVLSNLMALSILAKSYMHSHRRAKAPFLLLAATLLLTDLAGIVITGAFALYLHLGRVRRHRAAGQVFEPTQGFCKLFGSCMVFFGLCPLFLGSAMAVERCLGITQPLLHSAVITTPRVRLAVLPFAVGTVLLAVLPLLDVGNYTPQFPGTWCFLPVHGSLSRADTILALTFSSLGLVALTLSVLCNIMSGITLLQARLSTHAFRPNTLRQHNQTTASSVVYSLDIEMMIQLAVITVVSCVCWGPFLIYISISVRRFYEASPVSRNQQEHLLLLCLRMASWNQILDPWVYILLRRAILNRVCRLLRPNKAAFLQSSSCEHSHRQEMCLH